MKFAEKSETDLLIVFLLVYNIDNWDFSNLTG